MNETTAGRSRVQSVDRAFALLDALTLRGGRASLGDLVADTGLAAATVHRLCGTLAESGHLRRDARRDYLLGPRLQRIGDAARRATLDWAEPVLTAVVAGTGETANMAVREGDGVVYLAQVPSPHSMRMFTEVGRRVEVHCTAVGKALVADDDDDEVRAMLRRAGMRRYTPTTIVDADAWWPSSHGFGFRDSRPTSPSKRRGFAVWRSPWARVRPHSRSRPPAPRPGSPKIAGTPPWGSCVRP